MNIETLKSIFAPKTEIVNRLPNVVDKSDGDIIVVQGSTTYDMYILIKGKWRKVLSF